MATLTDQDILDLVTGTLKKLGRGKFQNIAQTLQSYIMMDKWLKKDKVLFDGGIGIQRTIMNKLPDAAAHVGMYDKDQVNVTDLLTTMNVPWRHARTYWAADRREILMNAGSEEKIVDVLQVRKNGALVNFADVLESAAWSAPSTTDTKTPYGIPYYVTTYGATSTFGFNGTVTRSHTTIAGINPTTSTTWRNGNATYTNWTQDDGFATWRTAFRKSHFKSPININDFRNGSGYRYSFYTGEANLNAIERAAEDQNDNLGRDVASMDDVTTFHRLPIYYVPQLDSATSPSAGTANYPLYGIDNSVFYPAVLKGDYLRESEPRWKDDQHNVFVVFVDLTYNFVCVDRRANFVLSTSAET